MSNNFTPWIIVITILASGACKCTGFSPTSEHVLSRKPVRSHAPLAIPTNPVSSDVGKGIEAKLDQLLDALKSLTLDTLKAAYFQGVLHGVLASSVMFVILIAFNRKGES